MTKSSRFLAVAGVVVGAMLAYAQSFEAASIKLDRSGDGSSGLPRLSGGRMNARNATMMMVLRTAYNLAAPQIVGPSWIDNEHYDIEAKAPDGTPDSALQPLLQTLLKERFHLETHMEKREMPVYNLVVANGGPKIAPFDPQHIPPTPPRNGADSAIMGPMTMTGLAQNLTSPAGRIVFDRTGLHGQFFCIVMFSRLGTQTPAGDVSGYGDIFAAVQEQLGLKLEPARAPVEVLVVDRLERQPTDN